MPGSFKINAWVAGKGVLGPQFIVSFEGLGLHKMLPLRGFEPSTSRMPGKLSTTRQKLPLNAQVLDLWMLAAILSLYALLLNLDGAKGT